MGRQGLQAIAHSIHLGAELGSLARAVNATVQSSAGDSGPVQCGPGGGRLTDSAGRAESADEAIQRRDVPAESYVYNGGVELLDAKWSLGSGRTVEFRIIEEPGNDKVNPFKKYTRRRGGRAGQSLFAAIVPDGSDVPVYSGECCLAGWSDSSTKGQSFTLWLDEESSLHPFAGYSHRSAGTVGAKFGAVVVVTDEPGGVPEVAEGDGVVVGGRQRSLSSDAHLMVTGERFIQFLEEKSEWTEKLHKQGRSWSPDLAKRFVKFSLNIESLSLLDQYPDKAKEFHEKFRRPFAKWNGQE